MIRYFKLILNFFFYPCSFVFVFFYKTRIMSFKTAAIILSKIPGYIGNVIRGVFYKNTLHSVGDNFRVFYGTYFVYPDVSVGNNCTIEENCVISLCDIGNDVIIAANVSIMSGNKHHDVGDIQNTFYNSSSILTRVKLGNNLWIGTHAVIMADVSSHTAVGAGSVVTKTFPEYMVIGGVPARILKSRI